MKKRTTLFASLLLPAALAFAQETSFGLKAGLNLAKVTNVANSSSSGSGGYSSSSKLTFNSVPQFGVYVNFGISDFLAFQPEVLFSVKGYKYHWETSVLGVTSESDTKVGISYIEVPLQLRINLSENIALLGGPYAGILVGAKSKTKTVSGSNSSESSDTSKDGISSMDFGLNVGGLFQMENGFNFGAKYGLGLADVFDNSGSGSTSTSDDTNAHSVIQVFVGLQF